MPNYDKPPKSVGHDEYEIVVGGKIGRAKGEPNNIIIPPLYDKVTYDRLFAPNDRFRFFVCERMQTYTIFDYKGFLIFEDIPFGTTPVGYEETYSPPIKNEEQFYWRALYQRILLSRRCVQQIINQESKSIQTDEFSQIEQYTYNEIYGPNLKIIMGKLSPQNAERQLNGLGLWDSRVEFIKPIERAGSTFQKGSIGRIGYGHEVPYNIRGQFNFLEELPIYLVGEEGQEGIIGVDMASVRLLRIEEYELHNG